MTRKLVFMLVASVTLAPQIAHTSCSGSACNSISVEGRNYSTSEKRAKAAFINKDNSRKVTFLNLEWVKPRGG